ncbi:MAG TPA: hypothetical protein VFU12_07195 [Glycomyces sp.]|nr:hypothetical protein [Glycomyces sp.]
MDTEEDFDLQVEDEDDEMGTNAKMDPRDCAGLACCENCRID